MTNEHLVSELDRAEKLNVTAESTKNPSHALQFPKKSVAIAFAKSLGWPASSATRVRVLGFHLWVLWCGSFTYLTARGALRSLHDRGTYPALAPAVRDALRSTHQLSEQS